MYNEKVMDVFKNPKNVGEIENPDGIGTVGSIFSKRSAIAAAATSPIFLIPRA